MKYQSLRGMQDFNTSQSEIWQQTETILKKIAESYGFLQVRLPLLETTELFSRATGESTDIVEKEMYTFFDKENNSISLRPEGTASCVRALVEGSWTRSAINNRFYYLGSMFRYEKPQKGRFREFNQFGVESFCNLGIDSDIEIILLSKRIFSKFNLLNKVELNLNYLGGVESRDLFKKSLVEYLIPIKKQLDSDSQRRLLTNPLRILDSKNTNTQAILKNAPMLRDFLKVEEKAKFESILNILNNLNIQYTINSNLIRGLDYYTGLVFEWVTNDNKAQNAVCSGGRYDNLVEELGGTPTPAVGFAIGLERLIDLLQETNFSFKNKIIDYYIIWSGDKAYLKALEISEKIRERCNDLKLIINKGNISFKNQFSKANEVQAQYALILGDNEVLENKVSLKNLSTKEQFSLSIEDFLNKLS